MKKKILCLFVLFSILFSMYSEDQLTNLENEGRCFYHRNVYTIADSASLIILLDYSSHTSGSKRIIAIPGFYQVSNDLVTVKVYSGTDYTGGTAINFYSTYPDKGITFESSVTYGATGSDLGTLIDTMEVGTSSTNQNAGGGSSKEGIKINIPANSGNGLIVISNESGNSINLTYLQIFYEY